jgi:hypothetical protein
MRALWVSVVVLTGIVAVASLFPRPDKFAAAAWTVFGVLLALTIIGSWLGGLSQEGGSETKPAETFYFCPRCACATNGTAIRRCNACRCVHCSSAACGAGECPDCGSIWRTIEVGVIRR